MAPLSRVRRLVLKVLSVRDCISGHCGEVVQRIRMLGQSFERGSLNIIYSFRPGLVLARRRSFPTKQFSGLKMPRPRLPVGTSAGHRTKEREAAIDYAKSAFENAVAGDLPHGPGEITGIPACECDNAENTDDADTKNRISLALGKA